MKINKNTPQSPYVMSKAYRRKLNREDVLNINSGKLSSEDYDKKFKEIQADFRKEYKEETGLDLT